MGNPLKKLGDWVATALIDKVIAPLQDINTKLDAQAREIADLGAKIEAKHRDDPAALECDLAVLDDRICYLIGKCREKGYTTAEDRRRVGRMHDAYRSRGGNHGEENEYERFCQLPCEEEWRRRNV